MNATPESPAAKHATPESPSIMDAVPECPAVKDATPECPAIRNGQPKATEAVRRCLRLASRFADTLLMLVQAAGALSTVLPVACPDMTMEVFPEFPVFPEVTTEVVPKLPVCPDMTTEGLLERIPTKSFNLKMKCFHKLFNA